MTLRKDTRRQKRRRNTPRTEETAAATSPPATSPHDFAAPLAAHATAAPRCGEHVGRPRTQLTLRVQHTVTPRSLDTARHPRSRRFAHEKKLCALARRRSHRSPPRQRRGTRRSRAPLTPPPHANTSKAPPRKERRRAACLGRSADTTVALRHQKSKNQPTINQRRFWGPILRLTSVVARSKRRPPLAATAARCVLSLVRCATARVSARPRRPSGSPRPALGPPLQVDHGPSLAALGQVVLDCPPCRRRT
jgi:hypothetical protein